MAAHAATGSGIGSAVPRKEDDRYLRGMGEFVGDIRLAGMRELAFVRSPIAHGRIGAIAKPPGREAQVFTAADLHGVKPILAASRLPGFKVSAQPALAVDKVRHVGEAIAVCVADTRAQAEDLAAAVQVEFVELPAVVDMLAARQPGATLVHEAWGDNVVLETRVDADLAAIRASAPVVVRRSLRTARQCMSPIEGRGVVAVWDRRLEQLVLHTSTQMPHIVRTGLAGCLGLPEEQVRVVAPDVGGGFGVKQFHYAEEAVITWATPKVGRPIKWVCERSEGFVSDAQGRDHVTEAELALDENGKFLALCVNTIANIGGYISTFGPNIPTNLYGPLLAGVYTTPAIYCEVKVVFTNTVPVDAYRGAGRPEATFVLERLVDIAASEMGIDRAEIRRRNMIPKEAYPYQTPVMVQYDSGDPEGCLEKALQTSDWANFGLRKQASAKNGMLRGIGLCTYIEACGLAPSRIAGRLGARGGLYESATVRVHPTGQVTVLIGTHNHGQGHETTYAQIVCEKLGVPFENIDVVYGDTDKVQFGMGTYGSRSLVVGGAALSKASDKIILKGRKIAAHLLESSEEDIEFAAGEFKVAGTDRKKAFADIALAAYVPHNYPLEVLEPGLEEQAYYDPINFTYPGGAHVAEVEIDPETGIVSLVNYTAVDDVGTIINPMIVEGQLHGGIVQGIGQALFENCVYDDASGQLLSGSFMDYCMPRADNLPRMMIATHSTPCTHTPMGVKGCGEVGTIGSPAAVANAVVDALAHLGVNHVDMPATANRVWRVMKSASLLQATE
ncbi:MAG TPA: xanthine dehydrogenase family protein molybdopterin-binding subunit [Xanthobacteraceae bacterium]|nr:xanthine dehydrogenase family protein molybdopterin-binding subunit [Xanthobacteraceae bacterium]